MIIFGYPGIGKTTLTTSEDYKTNFVNGVIDLDSMFFSDLDDPYWFKRYTNLAEYISKQGYLVMISTHEKVVSSLKKSPEKKLIIVPSPKITLIDFNVLYEFCLTPQHIPLELLFTIPPI